MTPEQIVQTFATGQQSQLKAAIASAQSLSSGIIPQFLSGMTDPQVIAQYPQQIAAWMNTGMTQAEAIQQMRSSTLAGQKFGYTATGNLATPAGVSTDPTAPVPTIDQGYDPATIDAWLSSGDPVTIPGAQGPTTYTQSELYNGAIFSMLGMPAAQNIIVGGMGSVKVRAAVGNKVSQIMTAYGLTPTTVASAAAEFKGMTAANTKLLNTALYTKTFTATATDNLNLALAESAKVPRGGARIPNNYLQWAQGGFTPAGPLAQLETYIYTASREYAKVTGGGVGSVSALTDTAQAQADKLLNAAQSPEVFAQVVTAMKNDMTNVNSEQGASLSDFAPNVSNLLGLATGGTSGGGTSSDFSISSASDPLGINQ